MHTVNELIKVKWLIAYFLLVISSFFCSLKNNFLSGQVVFTCHNMGGWSLNEFNLNFSICTFSLTHTVTFPRQHPYPPPHSPASFSWRTHTAICWYFGRRAFYFLCTWQSRFRLPQPTTLHKFLDKQYIFLNIWWPMPLFWFFISQICMRRVHFTYSNFGWGCMVMWTWGGVEASLSWSCIDVIVVRVRVSRGFEPFSPMGIDSADTNQSYNEENCMDKSHLLPNNPARQ